MTIKTERVDVQKVVEVSYKDIRSGVIYVWNGNKVVKEPYKDDSVYTRFGKTVVAFKENSVIDVTSTLETSSAEDRFIPAPKGTKVTIEN